MRHDGLLAPVARALGLDLVTVFGGGESGAGLVRTGEGAELVLKVLPGAEWAGRRSYLAAGDRVTAVFDWELAWAGDWRLDLVTLACWASWVPSQVTTPARRFVVDAARTACEPGVLALFTALLTLRTLDFDARVHPDRLPGLVATVDATTRAWLRGR